MVKKRFQGFKFDWRGDEIPVVSTPRLDTVDTTLTLYKVFRSRPAVNYVPEDWERNLP
jgi:hypothetical protein